MPDTKKSSPRISPKKLSNIKVVVLCIVTATTFWILNALNKSDYNTIVDFPIEFTYDQEEFVPVGNLPERLQIEINGNGWDLLRKYFQVNESPFVIDLTSPSKDQFLATADLKRPLAEFISPTELVSILEDSVFFQIDPITTLSLKPTLDSSSYELADNHKIIGDVTFTPSEILLKGAKSVLESFDGEFPIRLDEDDVAEKVSKKVLVQIPAYLENVVTSEDESILVSFDVVSFLEGNQKLTSVKRNFPNSVSLENEEAPILFYYLVDSREIEPFQEIEFEAIIDYFSTNLEDSTIQIKVNPIPEYMEILRVEPSRLKIKYD